MRFKTQAPQYKTIQRKSTGTAQHNGQKPSQIEKVSLITRLSEMCTCGIDGL
jgi:hypothetical protein